MGGSEALEMPLWRALVVFRLAALGYASLLAAGNFRHFAHPAVAWVVIAVMAAWTAVTTYAYTRPRWRGWPLLVADLVITAACLGVSPWILGDSGHRQGIATLPVSWIAGPVLAWAVSGGRRRGAIAAILLGGCDLAARGRVTQSTLDGTVLLLLAGIAVGHVARLAVDAQERLQRAVEVEVANRERDRLARVIHDSVLQVLALVQRRGAELGGEAAELGRLAGEQEARLRVLVGATAIAPAESSRRLDLRPARSKARPKARFKARPKARTKARSKARIKQTAGTDPVDLRPMLTQLTRTGVSLATPADPVPLPPRVAEEVAAAVGAALANVADHCGPHARAWVLVEDDGDAVTVSVRDEGPGIPAGRLDQAAADGRLGVTQSIRGRIRELGGTVAITSTPGQGTEVELRIPKGSL